MSGARTRLDLNSGRPVLLDGAMGTQLIERGLKVGEPSVLWNVDRPDDVLAVHRAYADAGSSALTTNTFGASPIMLGKLGLEPRMEELVAAAVRVCGEAAGDDLLVLGDVGPCGEFLDPLGDLEEAVLAEAVTRLGGALAEAGVNAFLAETFADPREMEVTVVALAGFGLPVLASFTFEKTPAGPRTMMGTTPELAARTALKAGAVAAGANCGTSLGLDDYLALADALVAVAGGAPVLLQPNAGAPSPTADGVRYAVTPDEFAAWGSKAIGKGVRMLGGCCGTTPEHIAALGKVLSLD